jgi:RNA polymerase sigma-70 factor (ECF subfamily)
MPRTRRGRFRDAGTHRAGRPAPCAAWATSLSLEVRPRRRLREQQQKGADGLRPPPFLCGIGDGAALWCERLQRDSAAGVEGVDEAEEVKVHQATDTENNLFSLPGSGSDRLSRPEEHLMGGAGLITTTVLLDSLKDPARDSVWIEFDARYRPILIAFGRQFGLNQLDAEEVAQETLGEFLRAYREGRYDRTKGRLSSWIISIAQNRALMRRRSLVRRAAARGESGLVDLRNPADLTQVWQLEQERAIFARAWDILCTMGRTEERTLEAFELVAMRGMPADVVAAECGMTVDEVYLAKSRVTRRLRQLIQDLTRAYEDEG